MVPMQRLSLKQDVGYHGKDTETDALLDDLELNEIERTTIADETQSVGWHLTAILEEGDEPRKENHYDEWPMSRGARLLQLQMTIPGQGHKDITQDE